MSCLEISFLFEIGSFVLCAIYISSNENINNYLIELKQKILKMANA